MIGFKDIAENYSSTNTGVLANYYAGICLLRTGKFEEAITYLEKYDGKDEMVAPVAIGAIGDANMELNKIDEAVEILFKSCWTIYKFIYYSYLLKKAGFAYEQKGNYTDALATYERLKNEYPRSTDAREVDKYIARVKTLGNIQ